MNLVYLWLLQFEKISTCDLGLPEIVHVSYRIPTCELGTLVTVAVWFCFSTCDLSLPETVHVIQNTYLWAWYTCDCCSLNTWLYLWTWFTWYCSCLNVVLPVNLIWLLVNISTCEFVCKIHFIVFFDVENHFLFLKHIAFLQLYDRFSTDEPHRRLEFISFGCLQTSEQEYNFWLFNFFKQHPRTQLFNFHSRRLAMSLPHQEPRLYVKNLRYAVTKLET